MSVRVCPHSDAACVYGMACTWSCVTAEYGGAKRPAAAAVMPRDRDMTPVWSPFCDRPAGYVRSVAAPVGKWEDMGGEVREPLVSRSSAAVATGYVLKSAAHIEAQETVRRAYGAQYAPPADIEGLRRRAAQSAYSPVASERVHEAHTLPAADFLEEAKALHAELRGRDWYALAGTDAERRLHERLTALASCDEFGELIYRASAGQSWTGQAAWSVRVPRAPTLLERIARAVARFSRSERGDAS